MLDVGAGRNELAALGVGPVHPGQHRVTPRRLTVLVGQRAEPFDGQRPSGQHRVDNPVRRLGVAVEPGQFRGRHRVQAQLLAESGGLGGAVALDPRFLKREHVRGGALDP